MTLEGSRRSPTATAGACGVERACREGWVVRIPAPVLTEVHTGRRDHARIDLVIKAVDMLIATTPERAKQAGELRSRSGVLDVVDRSSSPSRSRPRGP